MRRASIKLRLLVAGILLTAIPVSAISLLWLYESQRASDIAFQGSVELVGSDLQHVTDTFAGIANSYNQLLRQQVSVMLRVADSESLRLGAAHADGPAVAWVARNQFTQAETRISLPRFEYGKSSLSRDPDPHVRAILVDDVRDLTFATCTVFQRMNAAGDMLRVSTNVIAKNGTRAIGTFIPAVNPDGKPNPVLAQVLGGGTYMGRAFVVDGWYMSAYQPIRSPQGAIAGMLYVGIPEKMATASLQEMMGKMRFGPSGRVMIFNALGANRGHSLLASQPEIAPKPVLEAVSSRAVHLTPGLSEVIHYEAAGGRRRMIRFVYYSPWDWIIAVDAADEEVLTAALRIQAEDRRTRQLVFFVALAALLAASITWWRKAEVLSNQLTQVARNIRGVARGMSASTEKVVDQSEILERFAGVQNDAISRSSELGERLNRQGSEMREAVAKASTLMNSLRGRTLQSNARLEEMTESMRAINGSSNRIATIIKMIDEIALQTRMLALNASIEAARAGQAGVSFSVVAQQVGVTAQKCSDAAAETSTLIEACMHASASGSARLDGLVTGIVAINGDLNAADKIVADIAEISHTQAGDLSETADSLTRIGQATSQVHDTALQNALAGRTLHDQRGALDGVIELLETLCTGKSSE